MEPARRDLEPGADWRAARLPASLAVAVVGRIPGQGVQFKPHRAAETPSSKQHFQTSKPNLSGHTENPDGQSDARCNSFSHGVSLTVQRVREFPAS